MKTFKNYLHEEKQKARIDDFVDFATGRLGLDKKPNIIMLSKREPDMTTASYDIGSGDMKVLCGTRAIFDICRSIAHEMVHQKQHQEIEDPSQLDGSTGSPHENEANALAGQLIRIYGKQNPEFYDE
jgi:hypothetical protein